MNILYIGPYRQLDYIGQASRLYIRSIIDQAKKKNDNVKLHTRSVCIEPNLLDKEYSSPYEKFDESIDEYSIIVQHLPLEYLSIQKKFHNIAIPIVDARLVGASNNYYYSQLNEFDYILTDNVRTKEFLKRSNIKTKLDIFSEHIIPDPRTLNQRYNLGEINNLFKFGFIGPYKSNEQIIQKLIISYTIAFRSDTKTHLVLFLRGTAQDKSDIEKFYNNTKKRLKIVNDENRISFIFNDLNETDSSVGINTMDCYLSINDDIQYVLYENYAMSSKKLVLSNKDISMIKTPAIDIGDHYCSGDIIGSLTTEDIIQKMLLVANNNHKRSKSPDYPKLGAFICKNPL
jgi:hypothetical protein